MSKSRSNTDKKACNRTNQTIRSTYTRASCN